MTYFFTTCPTCRKKPMFRQPDIEPPRLILGCSCVEIGLTKGIHRTQVVQGELRLLWNTNVRIRMELG